MERGSHAQQSFKSTHIITLQYIVQIVHFFASINPHYFATALISMLYIHIYTQSLLASVCFDKQKAPFRSKKKKKCIS